jgi:uncharacterized BrkB/YihY/UPF0761 family membrane protein
VTLLTALLDRLDGWQRSHRAAAVTYGVLKKFGDDQANLLVVALGWYGFTAIYPLLLVVVTIFGFVGVASLGTGIVDTLHRFPVIGQQFSVGKGSHQLHGSVLGLVVGVLGLVYGAQGVTQAAEQAMVTVWNLPPERRPGFLPRLGRSVAALAVLGVAFVVDASVGAIATGNGHSIALRVPAVAGMLLLNVAMYFATFRILTPPPATARQLLPGAVAGAIGFTLLVTVGTGLLTHELAHDSNTYGAFASVIGTVTFLLLVAKLSLYAAELNPVLARGLAPRSLRGEPTEADRRTWALLEAQQRRAGGRPLDGAEAGSAPAR